MSAPKFDSLNALLTSNGSQLRPLADEARRLVSLRETVRKQLPPVLAPHCLGAQLEAGTLIIYMDSAASATPIRYLQRELIERFDADGLICNFLKVQVLPDSPRQPKPQRVDRTLPNTVRQILETTAAQLADGPLKNSLLRLARNHNPHQ